MITARIAHLLARGVDPAAILAVTFTNKAAGEMRERVAAVASRFLFEAQGLALPAGWMGIEPEASAEPEAQAPAAGRTGKKKPARGRAAAKTPRTRRTSKSPRR